MLEFLIITLYWIYIYSNIDRWAYVMLKLLILTIYWVFQHWQVSLCYAETFNPLILMSVCLNVSDVCIYYGAIDVYIAGAIDVYISSVNDVCLSGAIDVCVLDIIDISVSGAIDVALGSGATGVFTNSKQSWELLHKVHNSCWTLCVSDLTFKPLRQL